MLKLGLLAGSSFFALCVMEFALRTYFPVRASIYEAEPHLLHRHIPNSRKMYRHPAANGGDWVLVRINSEGRRGELAAGSNVPKVLVYGDSFISAEFTQLQRTFVNQLGSKLNASTERRVQVLNCGVTAYGPDQSALRMEEDLKSIHPSLVLFAIYAGNDFGDLLRNKLFKLDADGSLITNHPSLAPSMATQLAAAQEQPSLHLLRAVQGVLNKSKAQHPPSVAHSSVTHEAPTLLMDMWLKWRTEEYRNYIEEGDNTVSNLFEDGYDADVSLEPDSPSSKYRQKLMAKLLGHIRDVTAKHSVPLAILVIPAPFDIIDDYDPKPDARQHPKHHPEGLTSSVEQLARENQIPCLNLFEPFKQSGASNLYYRAGNDHWNDAGQAKAAELTARFIEENQLLHR